tara:strand:- start:11408 stop:11992 length:585 start_codon:yes stop_codon:yes gene_type:complete
MKPWNMGMQTKNLKTDVKKILKAAKMSLSTASKNMGWSPNRLGQILNQSDVSSDNLVKICDHFRLDIYNYADADAFPYFWRVKHLMSDCSIPYFKTTTITAGHVCELYGDEEINFKAWGESYRFPPGSSLIVTENFTDDLIGNRLYAIADKDGDRFKIVMGEKVKGKPKYVYSVVSIAVAGGPRGNRGVIEKKL